MPSSRFCISTHPSVVRNCEASNLHLNRNLQAAAWEFCSCFPGGRPTHPPSCALACRQDAKRTPKAKAEYSTVPGTGSSLKALHQSLLVVPAPSFGTAPCALACMAADDGPVISHSRVTWDLTRSAGCGSLASLLPSRRNVSQPVPLR